MKSRILIVVALLALLSVLAPAEVTESSAGAFTVQVTLNIAAPPDQVYGRLVKVGDWWDSAHTFSGDAHNLTIDPKPLGCYCEKLPNGGGVRHMEVVYVAPGRSLRMIGGIGPLQAIPVNGVMTIELAAAAGGTKLDMTYSAAGAVPNGLTSWAQPVDGVLTQQFTRLKNFTEHGSPDAAAPKKP